MAEGVEAIAVGHDRITISILFARIDGHSGADLGAARTDHRDPCGSRRCRPPLGNTRSSSPLGHSSFHFSRALTTIGARGMSRFPALDLGGPMFFQASAPLPDVSDAGLKVYFAPREGPRSSLAHMPVKIAVITS